MRIGELARLGGVSPRTVRYYHQLGVLLPEPARAANGYREYGIEDAVLLARARRLVDVGLGLEEVAEVLRDDRGRDLDELLAEVAADLADRERALQDQRHRIVALRSRLHTGSALADALDEKGLVEFFDAVRGAGARGDAVERDRHLLSLLEGESATQVGDALAEVVADKQAAARLAMLYERFDALAHDPRPEAEAVNELAAGILAALPLSMVTQAREQLHAGGAVDLTLVTHDLAPGQQLVVDALVALLAVTPDSA